MNGGGDLGTFLMYVGAKIYHFKEWGAFKKSNTKIRGKRVIDPIKITWFIKGIFSKREKRKKEGGCEYDLS